MSRFFGSADCPAKRLSPVFLAASDREALDWRLLPGLAMVESTGGKFAPGNNMFGWANGKVTFADPGEGIRTVAWNLSHGRYYRNKNLRDKLKTYNPNEGYMETVISAMKRLSPGEVRN